MHFPPVPTELRNLFLRLQTHGFAAYLVGGCVRDGLMGRTPHDWDICTAATPSELLTLFPGAAAFGMRHGTVTVLCGGAPVEITTFRAEAGYSDHRHPDAVRFVTSLEEDLARRDFTVNAMALSPEGVLTDLFGGQRDLAAHVLRTVGRPEARFREDALRMFRAVRFAAQLGFSLAPGTEAAIRTCAGLAETLPAERIRGEIGKALCAPHPEKLGMAQTFGLLPSLPPDAPVRWDMLAAVPPERSLRWMALAALVTEAGLSPDVPDALCPDGRTAAAARACAALSAEPARTEGFWKEAVSRFGRETAADAAAVLSALRGTEDSAVVQAFLERGDCCTLRELALGGEDLLALGYRGKELGVCLNRLLCHVRAHPEDNHRTALLRRLAEGGESK